MVAAVFSQRNQTDSSYATELCRVITTSPSEFLRPTKIIQQNALHAAKAILDPLATEVAAAQIARRDENKRKRKRGSEEVTDPVLQLRQIYVGGLGVKQVWEQAKRVLDAAYNEIEQEVNLQIDQDDIQEENSELDVSDEGSDLDGDDLEEDGIDDQDRNGEFTDDDGLEDENDVENLENIEDDSDILASSDEEKDQNDTVVQETYVQDPNNLNDGFFSIDQFNKQSQFLEQMDVRGEDEDPSDEDDIDWSMNPLTQDFAHAKPGRQADEEADGMLDNEDEAEGPTFGNVDLNGADSDQDGDNQDEIDGEDLDGGMLGLANANEVRYADFFEPPPKKPSKNKRMRALPKTQPPRETGISRNEGEDDLENDMERAMADVHRDLLDSDADASDEENEEGSKFRNLSTHEQQKAQIAQEIRRLEAANVARKDWTLSGEASAKARPLNSLLDEGGNLEFERAGKPVPVITAEVSEDIEALIKRRILAREFDEVVRRHASAIGDAAETRRGRIELDDTKATTGLGEIYEQEHLRQSDPTAYVDKRSAATKKQHDEIDRLWKEVREQLDVLGNLHFKPKRLDLEIKAVEDKPRIAMEDARPAVAVGGASDADEGGLLAPQEVYRPGAEGRADKGEVLVEKTGATRNKEEMTREEKLRRRRREKEKQKKAKGNQPLVQLGRKDKAKAEKKKEQQGVLDDLKKGGVKVVGKGGELQNLANKKKKNTDVTNGDAVTSSSSAMKL